MSRGVDCAGGVSIEFTDSNTTERRCRRAEIVMSKRSADLSCRSAAFSFKSSPSHRLANARGQWSARTASPVRRRPRPRTQESWTTSTARAASPDLAALDSGVFHRVHVILHGAKRVIEKASLPQFSGLAAAVPEPVGRAELDGLHRRRDGKRVGWEQDGMPMVGEKYPGRQPKSLPRARGAEAPRQKSELQPIERPALRQQLHRQEEEAVRQDKAPQPGHGRQRTTSRRCLSSVKAADPNAGSALPLLPLLGSQIHQCDYWNPTSVTFTSTSLVQSDGASSIFTPNCLL